MSTLDPAIQEAYAARLQAVDANPGDRDAWLQLGVTYHANARPDLAVSCYEVLAGFDPRDARVHALHAMALDDLGRREQRLEAMQQAIQHEPRNVEHLWRLSRYQLADGRMEQAIASGERARAIDNNNVQAVHALAHALLEAEQDARAGTMLEAWLVKRPGDLHAHHLLGIALRNQGRLLAAQGHVAAGVGSGPDWRGEDARMIETWTRGVQAERQRALLDLDSGRVNESLATLQGLAADHPGDATLVLNLGMAQLAAGSPDVARELFENAIAIHPELEVAHRQLAAIELRGRKEEALRADPEALARAEAHLRRAHAVAPEGTATKALLGRVLVLQGKTGEALVLLAEAARARPGDVQLGFSTARLLVDQGHHEEAMSIIEVGRVIRPDDPQLVMLAASAHAGLGHHDTARSLLQNAERRWPRHPGVKAAIANLGASE